MEQTDKFAEPWTMEKLKKLTIAEQGELAREIERLVGEELGFSDNLSYLANFEHLIFLEEEGAYIDEIATFFKEELRRRKHKIVKFVADTQKDRYLIHYGVNYGICGCYAKEILDYLNYSGIESITRACLWIRKCIKDGTIEEHELGCQVTARGRETLRFSEDGKQCNK